MTTAQRIETRLDKESVESMSQQEHLALFWEITASLSQQSTKAEFDQHDADIDYLIAVIGFNPYAEAED